MSFLNVNNPASARVSSILSESPEDDVYWNKSCDKAKHLKCDLKLDISEVFKIQKTFLNTETIFQTELSPSKELSDLIGANIYLKR